MTEYRSVDNTKEFIALLIRSRIATEAEVAGYLAAYQNEFLPVAAQPDTIAAFCVFLVSTGVLTPWQCQKLREGKWKGFYLDRYVLLDKLDGSGEFGYYLAREVDGRAYVKLAVTPQSRAKSSQIEFHIAEQWEG